MSLLSLIPSWAWLIICGGLFAALLVSTVTIDSLRDDLAKAETEHFRYVADVMQKQAAAVAEQRDIEVHNFRNSERVAHEQQVRDKRAFDELANLQRVDQRVRVESKAFRAATARDASGGNTAALAARAALATELYEACGIEYRSMAKEAELVRVQAVGLWEYIRGNSMCSTSFGWGMPEPAK